MTILTDKTALSAPEIADFMHVVDVSDVSGNAAGTSKKVLLSDVGNLLVGNAITILNKKSDLPAPSGGSIAVPGNTNYQIGSDFSIDTDNLDLSAGNISWSSGNIFGRTVTYTGTGNMFEVTGANAGTINIFNTRIDCPSGTAFDITDLTPGTSIVLVAFVQIDNCVKEGTFTDLASLAYTNNLVFDTDDGVSVVGTDWSGLTFLNNSVISTSSSFVGVDLGTIESPVITIAGLNTSAPASAIGVSGAASNANVTAGNIATFRDCKFLGGMTDISGLTTEDVQWAYRDNSPTPDTMPDALVSTSDNVSSTVSTGGVPVAIVGTFTEQQASHFTTTAAGLVTYIGEKDLKAPIDIIGTVHSATGSNKDVDVFLALNGSTIADSKKEVRVSSNSRENVSVPWQLTLTTGDTLQGFGANITDNVGIVYRSLVLRVL